MAEAVEKGGWRRGRRKENGGSVCALQELSNLPCCISSGDSCCDYSRQTAIRAMPTESGCYSYVCVQFVCVWVCSVRVCVQYMGTVYGMHGTQLDPLLASYAAYVKAQQAERAAATAAAQP